MSEPIVLSKNGALFVNGTRRHRDVVIVKTGDVITVARVSQPDKILDSYTVAETVTDFENRPNPVPPKYVDAFDGYSSITGPTLIRIAVASGCGCSGIPPTEPSSGYSGTLDGRGKRLV